MLCGGREWVVPNALPGSCEPCRVRYARWLKGFSAVEYLGKPSEFPSPRHLAKPARFEEHFRENTAWMVMPKTYARRAHAHYLSASPRDKFAIEAAFETACVLDPVTPDESYLPRRYRVAIPDDVLALFTSERVRPVNSPDLSLVRGNTVYLSTAFFKAERFSLEPLFHEMSHMAMAPLERLLREDWGLKSPDKTSRAAYRKKRRRWSELPRDVEHELRVLAMQLNLHRRFGSRFFHRIAYSNLRTLNGFWKWSRMHRRYSSERHAVRARLQHLAAQPECSFEAWLDRWNERLAFLSQLRFRER